MENNDFYMVKYLCQIVVLIVIFYAIFFFETIKYAITQMITERSEPSGAASPIGKSVCANILDIRYETGIRTKITDKTLCKNEIAIKYIGLFESPIPLKIELMML